LTGLKPGSTATKCITVTYSGNLASSVKLYGASYTGTLGTYLNLSIDQGTGATNAACASYSNTGSIYSGTLAGFVGASSNFGNGIGTFTPSATATASYRFTYTVQDTNSAMNLTSTVGFTWEVQNT
jgi:hypothetical protein